MHGLSFEERMALLVEREVHWRNDKREHGCSRRRTEVPPSGH
jgi:hypothetical protein